MIDLGIDSQQLNQAVGDMIVASIKSYGAEKYNNRIHNLMNSIISQHEAELKEIIWGYLIDAVKSEDVKKIIYQEYAKKLADNMVQKMKYQ